MTEIIGWLTVDNCVDKIMVDNSLKHTLKRAKKIKRRTRALNMELRKFSRLKSYSEYVTVKTDILRDISDNEDTDDEPFGRSAISLSSSCIDNASLQSDRSTGKSDLLKGMSEEELEKPQSESDKKIQKKTHPTITCTEIVKSKYLIIRDKESNGIDEYNKLLEYQSDPHSPEGKDTNGLHILSPEVGRVNCLKRIDSFYDDSASDTSHDTDDEMLVTTDHVTTGIFNEESSSSSAISDLSDCDERSSSKVTFGQTCKPHEITVDNYSSYACPVETADGNSAIDCTRKSDCDVPRKQSTKKSIKDQIAEQEFIDSNNETMIIGDKTINKQANKHKTESVVDSVSNGVPSDVESLRYVLRNLCSTANTNSDEYSSTDELEYSSLKSNTSMIQQPMKILPRPMGVSFIALYINVEYTSKKFKRHKPMYILLLQLQEFIDQQQLIPSREISTLNVDDIESTNEQNDHDEIWLMEIPRSVRAIDYCLIPR